MTGKTPNSGRCLCGATAYKFDARAVRTPLYCHCESCRRATSAPLTAYFTLPDSAWRWSGAAPGRFASSPGVTRTFCTACGSPMSFATSKRPGETDFHLMTLHDPEALAPAEHAFFTGKPGWLRLCDDLPGQTGD